MTRLETMQAEALKVGLYVDTYSPGDGVTRWRFFTKPSDYFGPHSGIFTALGWGEAETFLTAFALGYHVGDGSI